jgi:hypothetical protein
MSMRPIADLVKKYSDANGSSFNEATSSAAGGNPTTVPDDLSLSCGCHFHWYVYLISSYLTF